MHKNPLFLVSGQLLNSQRQTQVLLSRWAKEWMGVKKRRYWKLIIYVVVAQSLPPHRLHHTRLSHPSQSPGVCSNSCPLSQWYHPTISSSIFPFSSCPQSFPASGSSPMSQLFTSGGQSIRASASASVLPMNIQGWFPLGLTGLISLQSKGLSRVFSSTTLQKHKFFGTQPSLLNLTYYDHSLSSKELSETRCDLNS